MAESQNELVLAQNQFAFIQDETKGHVQVYVGPFKTGLTPNDRPVVLDAKQGKFIRCSLSDAITLNPSAPEGHYIVLQNPSAEASKTNPVVGSNAPVPLQVGRKVNLAGPATFSLWPGQVATTIPGHHLRSNQYLIVRVYNPEEANKNWLKEGVVDGKTNIKASELSMGKMFIIKGTDVSFYIPPTGIEVLPDHDGDYVRNAVTLETLEYCILLDENGKKRFEHGPKVVFPEATERFVEKGGDSGRTKIFKAVELNDQMGLYIKVLADYTEDDKEYKQGDELFITGKEQRIYYPRSEHALIEYDDPTTGMKRQRYYGITVPKGEARYVLDKRVGDIKKVNGPCIFLPDPRYEVMVRRILDTKKVQLWYPNNNEAVQFNEALAKLSGTSTYLAENQVISAAADITRGMNRGTQFSKSLASNTTIEADTLKRGGKFTPPPMLTLNTKYDGVPAISVWTGYAVQVVNKAGERRVVAGPSTILLDYDETLEVLELSTGKPKTTDQLLHTVYLRVENNRVSDVVTVETKDLVNVNVKLSYRVNFEGDNKKWFRVENYVKFLCDHLRSVLRSVAKRYTVSEFIAGATDIIRDSILGKHEEGKPRAGKSFEENGMKIYDVEVLGVEIGDSLIAKMLVDAQRQTVEQAIRMTSEEQKLENTKRMKAIEVAIADITSTANLHKLELALKEAAANAGNELANIKAENTKESLKIEAKLSDQERLNAIRESEVAREKAQSDLALEVLTKQTELFKDKFAAITPDLVAALNKMSDTQLATDVAKAALPLAIMEQQGVETIIKRLFGNTPIAEMLNTKK